MAEKPDRSITGNLTAMLRDTNYSYDGWEEDSIQANRAAFENRLIKRRQGEAYERPDEKMINELLKVANGKESYHKLR